MTTHTPLLILFASLLAACGSDGGDDPTTDATATDASTSGAPTTSDSASSPTTTDDPSTSVAESSGSTSDGVDSSGSSGDSTSDGSGTTDGTTGDTSGTTGQLECEQCISDAEANVCADEFGACGNDQYCGEIGSCCLATPDACDECGCEAFESSGDAWNAYAACIEDVCAGCGPAQCGV